MSKDYEKRFYTLDGKTRITIYREEYPESPRDMTDEPFHCEDWSRDKSIMNEKEQEYKVSSARIRIERLAEEFGDYKKIIDFLVENGKHMTDGKSVCNNALVYDKSLHGWALKEYTKWYGEKEHNWKDADFFDGKKYDIDLYTLLDVVLDGTIDYIAENCMTDKVKLASYGFGYYGGISFDDEVSCKSEGICWLEKDEFLKYSGNDEEYWKKPLTEIEWLCDELDAWSNGYVYGYKVEHKHVVKVTEQHEDGTIKEYERIDWDDDWDDSCWGFYGDLWKEENLNYILCEAGFKREELTEDAA